MTAAYDVASRVLSAAADGETVSGFESVGDLLIDLRRTRPVPSGSALGTSAVAAANAASTPRFSAVNAVARFRPRSVLLSLMGAVVAGSLVLAQGGDSSAEIGPTGDRGVDQPVTGGGGPGDDGTAHDAGVARVVESADGETPMVTFAGPNPVPLCEPSQ